MHQGWLQKILWITSSTKAQNISPIKKESLSSKNNIKKGRTDAENTNLSRIKANTSKDYIRANYILVDIIPIEESNYHLNKQQFLDAVWLRCWLPKPNFWYTTCSVVQERIGFETLCHKKLRDITGALLEEVCHNVAI